MPIRTLKKGRLLGCFLVFVILFIASPFNNTVQVQSSRSLPTSLHTYVYAIDLGQISILSGKKLVKTIHDSNAGSTQGAYDPVNGMVYVPNKSGGNNGTVSVISTSNNSMVKTIHGFEGPVDAQWAPKNNCIYVADVVANKVFVINATTNKVIGNITVGDGPTWMA
jgi:YVTN family beta-propeller protein